MTEAILFVVSFVSVVITILSKRNTAAFDRVMLVIGGINIAFWGNRLIEKLI